MPVLVETKAKRRGYCAICEQPYLRGERVLHHPPNPDYPESFEAHIRCYKRVCGRPPVCACCGREVH